MTFITCQNWATTIYLYILDILIYPILFYVQSDLNKQLQMATQIHTWTKISTH